MIDILESGIFISKDYFNKHTTPQRTVNRCELELYLGGDGFSIINGLKYPHAGCHFIFSRPGDQRFSIGLFECYYVHFKSDEPEIARIAHNITRPSETAVSSMKKLIGMEGLRRTAAFCELLADISVCRERPRGSEKYMDEILMTKEYMEKNYGSRITLDELAGMVYLSKNFYRTTFSRIMETSPQKYLQNIRVAKAIELIRDESIPLCDIAQSCGFENQSYMNYVFKKVTGKTPSEFKNIKVSAHQV